MLLQFLKRYQVSGTGYLIPDTCSLIPDT